MKKLLIILLLLTNFAFALTPDTTIVGPGDGRAGGPPSDDLSTTGQDAPGTWKFFAWKAGASGEAYFFGLRIASIINADSVTDNDYAYALYDADSLLTSPTLKVWGYTKNYNLNTIGVGRHYFDLDSVVTNRTITAGNWYAIGFRSSIGDNGNAYFERAGSDNLVDVTVKKGASGADENDFSEIPPTSWGINFNPNYYGWTIWSSVEDTVIVSSTNGTIAHGDTLSISGSGFGIKSPAAPLMWDDCENKTVDNDTAVTDAGWVDLWPGISATVTATGVDSCYTRYRNVGFNGVSAPHNNSSEYLAGCHYNYPDNNPPYIGQDPYEFRNVAVTKDLGSGHTSINWYVSYYYTLSSTWNTDSITYNNHKITTIQQGGAAYTGTFDYIVYCNASGGPALNTGDSCRFEGFGSHVNQLGNCSAAPYTNNPRLDWVKVEEKIDSTYRDMYIDNVLGIRMTPLSNIRSYTIGGYYRYVISGGSIANTSDYRGGVLDSNWRFFDDMYIDTTLSRVMLGNASTYDNCTIVEPQIPFYWSTDSISVTINLGKLSAEDSLFLYVFNVDNEYDTTGYLVSSNPVIESVSGTISHGSTITINGNGFGSKSPAAPVLWDDCTDNTKLGTYYSETLPSNAQQGATYNMQYRDSSFLAGRSLSLPSDNLTYVLAGAHATNTSSGQYSSGNNVSLLVTPSSWSSPPAQPKFYVSYYYRIDSLFDEENNPTESENMKEFCISGDNNEIYGDSTWGYYNWCNSEVPTKNYTTSPGPTISRSGVDCPALPYGCSGNNLIDHYNPITDWLKMEWVGDYDTTYDNPTATLRVFEQDSGQTYQYQDHYGNALTTYETLYGCGYPDASNYRSLGIGGFAREPRYNNGVNCFRYFADVYVDITHSRVVLCDSDTFSSATMSEPQIPTYWSADSIVVTVNLGNLPADAELFLYVFDSDNEHNATGFSVNAPNGNDTTPPSGIGTTNLVPTQDSVDVSVSSISSDVDTLKLYYPDSTILFHTQLDNTDFDTTVNETGLDTVWLYYWAIDDSSNVRSKTFMDSVIVPAISISKDKLLNCKIVKE